MGQQSALLGELEDSRTLHQAVVRGPHSWQWERSFPLFCDCKTELMEVLQNVLPKPLQHWTPKDSWTLSYFCTLFCMKHSWAVPLVSQPKSVEVVSFVAAVLWERWKEDTKEREFRD